MAQKPFALVLALLIVAVTPSAPALAAAFSFSTGDADGKIGLASIPPVGGTGETEGADDFALTTQTNLSSASFTGLFRGSGPPASVERLRVKIYRAFPLDSDLSRTSGAPLFSTSLVPTRVNSPSDGPLAVRDSDDGSLSFETTLTSASFSVSNTVTTGINPKPNQFTGGDGAATGALVAITVTFATPLHLPADHYFFVPEVSLSAGTFLWLSAPKPIVAPGTPFPAGVSDLQALIRSTALMPDWLRVGTDIVGGTGTFNGVFSLDGATCPPIGLAPPTLPAGTVGTPYAAMATASGGAAPYRFTTGSALPAGVTLSAAGALSGTPTQAGSFDVRLVATDATGCSGTADDALTVAAATGPPPIIPPPTLPLIAPAITKAKLSHTTFRAATHGATLARRRKLAPIATTVTYRDSQAATTTFTVRKAATGHRSGTRCLAGRPHKRQKRCTRYVSLGSSAHHDVAGNVKVRFSGRIRGHRLAAARYHLTLTPKAGGRTGRTVTLAFRIASAPVSGH